MGGLTLEITGYGETIIKRELLRFAGNVEVPEKALDAAAVILRQSTELQFDTEGGYASGGWDQLKEATSLRKARLGLDPHILRATDRLKESLTRKFDPDHIERSSGDSLTFGSRVRYGIYHQSSLPRHKIPYRPPIALTEGDKRRMVKDMQRALLESRTRSLA